MKINKKFRAWDKDQKRWVYFELYPNARTTPQIYLGDFGDWQQLVAVKDGVEIYEGDVARLGIPKKKPKKYITIIVQFASNAHSPRTLNDNERRWEIIGNICENPELLDNKAER